MKNKSLLELTTYALVGLSNTAITLIIIYFLSLLKIDPYIANLLGYSGGLLNSFLLNRKYTFRSKKKPKQKYIFFFTFLIAYAANLATLKVIINIFSDQVIYAQLAGMIIYNISFFILMKLWVFKDERAKL